MKPIILFRPDVSNNDEYEILRYKTGWNETTHRSFCRDNFVIPRYSALPYYKELEEDLQFNNCRMVNSYEQFKYIADFHYYSDISDLTFPTWRELHRVPDKCFPIVVKGATNSRKHRWSTQMYAESRRDAALIAHELKDDVLIGQQEIIYRQYVPLRCLEEGIDCIRFNNEWRFFVYKQDIVECGFYWSQIDNDIPPLHPDAVLLVNEVINRVGNKNNFYVIDVAEKESGGFIVVEMNAGEQSGLSLIDPEKFYDNLYFLVNNE